MRGYAVSQEEATDRQPQSHRHFYAMTQVTWGISRTSAYRELLRF